MNGSMTCSQNVFYMLHCRSEGVWFNVVAEEMQRRQESVLNQVTCP